MPSVLIVAAYFTAFPDEADKFYAEAMAYQEKEENRQEELSDKVCNYVRHMKKDELSESCGKTELMMI